MGCFWATTISGKLIGHNGHMAAIVQGVSTVRVEMPHSLQAEEQHVNIPGPGKQVDGVSVISRNRRPPKSANVV